jgi:hypothetical protein
MGRRVYLIDTPGFDDTDQSDAETLELLATYLSASYAAGVHINGVLFLHRITDVRVGGSGVRNLAMLRAMCDVQSYARFTFVTTMWPDEQSTALGGCLTRTCVPVKPRSAATTASSDPLSPPALR